LILEMRKKETEADELRRQLETAANLIEAKEQTIQQQQDASLKVNLEGVTAGTRVASLESKLQETAVELNRMNSQIEEKNQTIDAQKKETERIKKLLTQSTSKEQDLLKKLIDERAQLQQMREKMKTDADTFRGWATRATQAELSLSLLRTQNLEKGLNLEDAERNLRENFKREKDALENQLRSEYDDKIRRLEVELETEKHNNLMKYIEQVHKRPDGSPLFDDNHLLAKLQQAHDENKRITDTMIKVSDAQARLSRRFLKSTTKRIQTRIEEEKKARSKEEEMKKGLLDESLQDYGDALLTKLKTKNAEKKLKLEQETLPHTDSVMKLYGPEADRNLLDKLEKSTMEHSLLSQLDVLEADGKDLKYAHELIAEMKSNDNHSDAFKEAQNAYKALIERLIYERGGQLAVEEKHVARLKLMNEAENRGKRNRKGKRKGKEAMEEVQEEKPTSWKGMQIGSILRTLWTTAFGILPSA